VPIEIADGLMIALRWRLLRPQVPSRSGRGCDTIANMDEIYENVRKAHPFA
jgi:hypothetical protein